MSTGTGTTRRKGATQGFTIIEVMTVIAVMGILFSIAVPAFQEMIAGQRIRTAASDVHGALLLARSEALKRNATVSITATVAANWTNGWTVGTDFLKQEAFSNSLVVQGPVSGTISFQWTGRPDAASSGAVVRISSSSYALPARCISLSLNGMPENKGC